MRQSPLLEFESSAFEVAPGEDEETNPGIFGKALAAWLAEQLSSAGYTTREIIAEDFGWAIETPTGLERDLCQMRMKNIFPR